MVLHITPASSIRGAHSHRVTPKRQILRAQNQRKHELRYSDFSHTEYENGGSCDSVGEQSSINPKVLV